MPEDVSMEQAELVEGETGEEVTRRVVGTDDIHKLLIEFDGMPRERESQFPSTDYYYSFPVHDLENDEYLIVNTSSKRFLDLTDRIAEENDGDLVGARGVILKKGERFNVQYGWVPEEKL